MNPQISQIGADFLCRLHFLFICENLRNLRITP